jgi:cell shape-determining protein MreC
MDKYTTAIPKLLIMLVISLALGLISNLGIFNEIQGVVFELNLAISRPFLDITRKLDDDLRLVNNLQQMQLENIQLKEQVAQLTQQLSTLTEVQEQNTFLLSQLNLQIPRPIPQLLATVVRYAYFPRPGDIYIEVGLNNAEVEIGDWATRYNYIVGKVIDINAGYARVRLINASESRIPVVIGPNAVVGELVGQLGLDYSVINVDQTAAVNIGDEVKLRTSDTDTGVNVDLTFGSVASISGLESDATKTIQINSPIDLHNLDYVILVTNND